jgi:hypothetical protein
MGPRPELEWSVCCSWGFGPDSLAAGWHWTRPAKPALALQRQLKAWDHIQGCLHGSRPPFGPGVQSTNIPTS